MSKSDTRSDIALTKELGLHRCSCGRCCNAKRVKKLEHYLKIWQEAYSRYNGGMGDFVDANIITNEYLEQYYDKV